MGAGASVAGFEMFPPVSGGDPPAPFAGGSTCGEEDGNSSAKKHENIMLRSFSLSKLRSFEKHHEQTNFQWDSISR